MAGVGRKPNASMSPGPDRRVGLSERFGLEQGRQFSDRILVHFSAGRGGFASRRDVQHKRAVKIADKLAHSVRVPVFIVVHQDRNRASAFALRQSEASR